MKKKFFLIGALVAMSMSAMFVACNSKNEPINGCNCTRRSGSLEGHEKISFATMQEKYGVSTCAELAKILKVQMANEAPNATVTCVGY